MSIVHDIENTPLTQVCEALHTPGIAKHLEGERSRINEPADVCEAAITSVMSVLRADEPATIDYVLRNIESLERRHAVHHEVRLATSAALMKLVRELLIMYRRASISAATGGWG